MTIPIPDYQAPFKPVPNVTPFSIRDGDTMLRKIDYINKYIERVLIPWIDENYALLGDQFETQVQLLIASVNAAIDMVINDSVDVQDPVVAGMIADSGSQTRTALNNVYATLTTTNALDVRLDILEPALADLETDINTALNAEIATRAANDTTNANAITAEATARSNADNGLDTRIDALELVTTGPGQRLTEAYLDGRYNPASEDPTPTGRITFIGDSYMVGTGLSNNADRWPSVMSGYFGVPNTNLSNAGSGYVNAGSSGNFVSQSANTPADSDTVIISGGINDAPLNPTQGTITAAVNSIVTNIRADAPNARIVFVSPMWFQNDISSELLTVADRIRTAVLANGDARYIDDAMFLRMSRSDATYGDGHPNTLGHKIIAGWVYDNLVDKPQPGTSYAHFILAGTSDVTFTGPSRSVIAGKTIVGARRGWYQFDGTAVMYGSTMGWLTFKANSYERLIRNDIISDTNPVSYSASINYYHEGGDLNVTWGYSPNLTGDTNCIPAGSQLFVRWMGYR
jgi:lysophospholipase L1-like esterase